MDDDALLALALATLLRRYIRLRTASTEVAPEDHEIVIGTDEIDEVLGLVSVVRVDEQGQIAISLARIPEENTDDDGEVDDGVPDQRHEDAGTDRSG